MKQNLLIFPALFLLIFLRVSAQQPSPTPTLYSDKTLNELKQIQQAAVQSNYAYKQTAYLSNNIGGRLTGSLQAERAVQYVAAEMRKLGLDARLQKLTVPHWVRGEEKGELVEFVGMAKGTTQKIVLTALGGSIAGMGCNGAQITAAVPSRREARKLGKAVGLDVRPNRASPDDPAPLAEWLQAGFLRRRCWPG